MVVSKKVSLILIILLLLPLFLWSRDLKDIHAEEIRIHLSFQQAEIEDVFNILESLSGYTMILHPGISGRITVHLDSLTIHTSIELITEQIDCEFLHRDDTFYIAPSKKMHEILQEEETRLFSLHSIPAKRVEEEIALHLPEVEQMIHEGWNTIILKGLPEELARAEAIIRRLDEERFIEEQFLYYPVQYTDKEMLLSILSSSLPDVHIERDERNHGLVLRGTKEDLQRAQELLIDLDRSIPIVREVRVPLKEEIDSGHISLLLTKAFPSLQVHTRESEQELALLGERDLLQRAVDLYSLLEEKMATREEVQVYSPEYLSVEEILSKIQRIPPRLRPDISHFKDTLILAGPSEDLPAAQLLLQELDDSMFKETLHISLNHIETSSMASTLEDLLPTLFIMEDSRRNGLFLVGEERDLRAAESIISRIDREDVVHEVLFHTLQFVEPSKISLLLQELLPGLTVKGVRGQQISLEGSREDLKKASNWMEALDMELVQDREISILFYQEDVVRRLLTLLPPLVPGLSLEQKQDALITIGTLEQIEEAERWIDWLIEDEDLEIHEPETIYERRPFELYELEVSFMVTGIVFRDVESLAIIEGEERSYILQVGDTFEGYSLIEIYREGVLIRDEDGQVYSLLFRPINDD